MNRLLPGVLALMLVGCGISPKTHYYSLTPVESAQPPELSSGPYLQVFHVAIPAVLDRDSLVEWAGAGELRISGTRRWAAPVDEMIQNVIAADLRRRLPDRVILPGDPVPRGETQGIAINVRHFAAENAQRVVLLADWSLVAGHPAEPILTRSEAIEVPLRSSRSSEVVSAMSKALAVFSDRIADTIYADSKSDLRLAHSPENNRSRAGGS
jgi:uncharacterized protein